MPIRKPKAASADPAPEAGDEKAGEATEVRLCRAKADGVRASCNLPKDHVRSIADWHHAVASHEQTTITDIYRVVVRTKEVIEWAPNSFEISSFEISVKKESEKAIKDLLPDRPSEE